ncbi:MAG: ribose-5-phosphate isomerase RpiA [Methanomicrobiales archaeon]|nr:ribose-5-phosphate isomerase RpiA [Methanomicrobiales archaeon]
MHSYRTRQNRRVIGLGTGSTVLFAMEKLAAMVRDGFDIAGVPTSFQAAMRARELGIPLTTLDDHPFLDLAIDGADQVDPGFRVIKGRGAAHLREKCVAAAAGRFIVVADPGKIVSVLDAAVPLEVLPFAVTPVLCALKGLSGEPVIREGQRKDGPVITDNGNMVIDCRFGPIHQPEQLEISLSTIPGVLSCGMFCGFTEKTTIIVGDVAGARTLTRENVL